jgi:ubiquitin-conjugating enzyme E2 I
VFQGGEICLSIINEQYDWRPAITIKQIAAGIQDLLISPNPKSPANGQAEQLLRSKPAEYKKRIREQAAKFASKE